ncbi:prepilin-type N-terminal cleavage/methylation domain-containing protein [Faecalibacillus faecis]|uniref:prepilin-type N-terminal cleavage/methylation domain-containing protein n=1 Tax=Faecalibacillus faecis TaxID=1982628 RepID=UPI0022E4B1AB|nr:prepilin-type N-terminal cleavage/methylation domain-containing protein [Faecalibacillus faecis]
MRRNRRGFTLVEIIVVLVILVILTAIAVPTALGYVDDAKEARELAKLRESLIAAQVTFVKSASFGESGSKAQISQPIESANRFLTINQSKDLIKGLNLEVNPYILMYGVGDPDVYGEKMVKVILKKIQEEQCM